MMNEKTTDPVRVLYCEGNIDGTVGGSYFSLLYLTKNLDRRLYTPIVVFYGKHDLLEAFENAGVKTIILEYPQPFVIPKPATGRFSVLYRLIFPVLRLLQSLINFFRFLPILALKNVFFLRRHKIDLLHLNNSIIGNHHWMLAALLSSTKFITHERGINPQYSNSSQFYAKHIDAIICISQAVQDSLKNGGISVAHMPVIHNGIDPNEMQVRGTPLDLHGQYGLDEDAMLIGVVGNVKQWKGQKTIVSALPQVLSKHPNTICMLIGDVTPEAMSYFNDISQLIEQFGIGDKVIFTGYTSSVAKYMSALDIIVHTSVDPEPFGRVLIEAMALRKPVIGSAAGGVPEIIDDGTTGLTFPPGDATKLADCILDILDNPKMARAMGDAGYLRLTDYFHISRNVAQTEQLYDDILSCKQRTPE